MDNIDFKDHKIVVPEQDSAHWSGLIVDVLESYGAIVVHGVEPTDFRHDHLEESPITVIAQCGAKLDQILPSGVAIQGILWVHRGAKKSHELGTKPLLSYKINEKTVDLFEISPNHVAKEVAKLLGLGE